MPDFLHVVPVGDNSVLNGIFQGEDTTLGLGFISDVGVSLFHSHLLETCKKEACGVSKRYLDKLGRALSSLSRLVQVKATHHDSRLSGTSNQ